MPLASKKRSLYKKDAEKGRPVKSSLQNHSKNSSMHRIQGPRIKNQKASVISPQQEKTMKDMNDSCEELRQFPNDHELNSLKDEDHDDQVYIRTSLCSDKSFS
mmetsp:Transcript_26895/g.25955  ORF Transcript_26895/g.25955 Transcript_26895/m.25955 type:complete len:103 (+) Transcript_26895:953-1261(+)